MKAAARGLCYEMLFGDGGKEAVVAGWFRF
jgi:hypothetical protein